MRWCNHTGVALNIFQISMAFRRSLPKQQMLYGNFTAGAISNQYADCTLAELEAEALGMEGPSHATPVHALQEPHGVKDVVSCKVCVPRWSSYLTSLCTLTFGLLGAAIGRRTAQWTTWTRRSMGAPSGRRQLNSLLRQGLSTLSWGW
eukprot:SAG11_NODE_2255_length_3620_cov_1.538483_5_plen_148_part_00